jgi:hypothetical protein
MGGPIKGAVYSSAIKNDFCKSTKKVHIVNKYLGIVPAVSSLFELFTGTW